MTRTHLFRQEIVVPNSYVKRKVKIKQLCVSVSFIHGFKGIWGERGVVGRAVNTLRLGKVAKLQDTQQF